MPLFPAPASDCSPDRIRARLRAPIACGGQAHGKSSSGRMSSPTFHTHIPHDPPDDESLSAASGSPPCQSSWRRSTVLVMAAVPLALLFVLNIPESSNIASVTVSPGKKCDCEGSHNKNGDGGTSVCPSVMPVHPKISTIPSKGGERINLTASAATGVPPFVIYNWGKSGSHFLTQTLTNLGFPVEFEYGLRRKTPTAEKTKNALEAYDRGKVYGFSYADFQWGDAQHAIDGGPTNWTDILCGLSSMSTGLLKHVVLLRTNLIARTIGSPAGIVSKHPNARPEKLSVEDLKKVTLKALKDDEEHNAGLVKNACRSAKALSSSGMAHIFVINYESLLVDPAKWFGRLVSFLGGGELAETEIVTAVEGGKFKRKHTSMIYLDVGLKGISDHLFLGDEFNATAAIKDCYLHQALAPFPREEYMCFEGCIIPSGMYLCPPMSN